MNCFFSNETPPFLHVKLSFSHPSILLFRFLSLFYLLLEYIYYLMFFQLC